MRKLRIVYMGTPDFAVYPLQKLLEAGQNIVAVVTNPDKPAGRGQKLQESAVKKFAVERGLPVLQPERFRDEQFLAELKALEADLQLVVAFKMLPEVVWNMPPLGTVNLHASLLPDYRGAAPINWAVMNGEQYSGVTTFLLKHEIDTGNLIFQQRVDISDTMTAGELHDQLMCAGADLLVKTVEAMAAGDYPLQEQVGLLAGREPKHAPKIFKEDMKVDWLRDLDTVYNHIRGLAPFPTAWTELKHKGTGECVSMKLFAVERMPGESDGKVRLVSDGKKVLDVHVKGGVIRIKELQLSGKKRMRVEEFLRGFHIEEYSL
ncbi:methionyl-tRNA formyltransferase [Butyricimonas synergistica]|uniref:methionyl-tRNA formyltransferase n=1 Tax=Butyricimonas synergistica TaxID=544644 RepID=UPI00037008B4|nr:methionyl-tRNA formyltransferase [Butyricimonas synergistica]